MIHAVDDALRQLLLLEGLPDNGVQIELDPPTREWASGCSSPTVSLFLYDVSEETGRRDPARATVRDDDGRVVGRPLPPRWVRLSYLITAWTQNPTDEHLLLGQLLSCLLSHYEIPRALLSADLAAFDAAITLQAALPRAQDRSISDIWSALGGELKPSIDLQVVAPLRPGDRYELAPLVEHPMDLQLVDSLLRAVSEPST